MARSLSRKTGRSGRAFLDRESFREAPYSFRHSRFETLEPRWTLSAAPILAPIANMTLASGTPLYIALDGYDADGDALLFTIDSTNDLLSTTISETNRSMRLVVENYGEMIFELFENLAPQTTAEIIQLAQGGFYNGLTFHRVAEYADGTPFVIQGGDPNGDGTGGPGFEFDDEYGPLLMHTDKGILSMAKSGDDTNGSQFFITGTATRHLDFNHSVFGYLVEGNAVREAIQTTAVDANSRPLNEVMIQSAEVFLDQQNGVLILSAPKGYTGEADVTVTVSDGNGGQASQTFHLTVVPDTVNEAPYLKPIDTIEVAAGGTTSVTLEAVDLEGDPVVYAGMVDPASNDIQLSISESTGVTTITATATAGGVYGIFVGIRAADGTTWDTQAMPVLITPSAPTTVDLLASSDMGGSTTDDLTNLDNTAGQELRFRVHGVIAGATVSLFADGVLIGQAAATSDSVVIVTNGVFTLTDGIHAITAVQGFYNTPVNIGNSDDVVTLESAHSATLAVTVDTTSPTFTTVAILQAHAGKQYVYDAGSNAETAGAATYSLKKSPSGMLIDAATGLITWTPAASHGTEQAVTVAVADAAGNTSEQSFEIAINRAPVIWPISDQQVYEGGLLTFAAFATDAESGIVGISFSLDAGAPAGTAIDAATGVFTWTPTEAQAPGTYNIWVRATDDDGATSAQRVVFTVLEVNQSPLLDPIPDAVVSEGQLLEFQAAAGDPDLPAQTLTFSLAPGSPAGATIDPTTGVFRWQPGEDYGGTVHTISVRVTDSLAAVAQRTFQVTVLEIDDPPAFEPIATQFVTVGSTFQLRAEAVDPDPETNAVRYAFDATVPDGMTIDAASGLITWSVPQSHPTGSVFVTVRATELWPDGQPGLSSVATFEVRVSAPLPDFIARDQVLGLSTERSILTAEAAREAADSLLFAGERRIRFAPVASVAPKDDRLFGPRIGTHGAGGTVTPEVSAVEKTSGEETQSQPQPSTSGDEDPSGETSSLDGTWPSESLSEDGTKQPDELTTVELLDAAFEQMADEQTATGA